MLECCLVGNSNEIANNVVCATSKADSDQPAHTRSLIIALASLALLQSLGARRWGYSDIFTHTYARTMSLGSRILNFNIFGVFQRNDYFWGYEDFVGIFGGHQINWAGLRRHFSGSLNLSTSAPNPEFRIHYETFNACTLFMEYYEFQDATRRSNML